MAIRMRRNLALDEGTIFDIVFGGSVADMVLSASAVLAAIVGLAGEAPELSASLSAVAVGGALLVEGGAIGVRFLHSMRERASNVRAHGEVTGGIASEIAGGVIGAVMSVLAFFGVMPRALLPAAAIVYGAGLLMGCPPLAQVVTPADERERGAWQSRDNMRAAASLQIVVGLGSVLLGLFALASDLWLTLSLTAFLLLGASELLSGLALGVAMTRMSRR